MLKHLTKKLVLTVLGLLILAVVLAGAVGLVLCVPLFHAQAIYEDGLAGLFSAMYLTDPMTWALGGSVVLVGSVLWLALGRKGGSTKKLLGGKADSIDSPLENSRFLTDKERDKYFPGFDFAEAASVGKDGVPVRALLDKKGRLQVNLLGGAHSLVIGSTGSGKTTTFINPMFQILGATPLGSSMIMTDPKGELFSLHSKYLQSRGYNVMVLDLRDTYSSYRWNPLESIWDMYQEYVQAAKGIFVHRDSPEGYTELQWVGTILPGDQWYEYRGYAYADRERLIDDITVTRQRIYDEMYEDLNDLISVICPIESKDDPVWEKGARSIVMAVCLAMLEDSEIPELGMTREKFNFFNINKIIANSEDNFRELKALGVPGSTVAGVFPWIYSSLNDERGLNLGSSDGTPTFVDFFRRDSERVNANMVIVGKSGGGKSYATKSLLSNLAADDAKIFVLDPENEYTELAGNLKGKFINVANAAHGRINPFHIITSLEDDEAADGEETSSYAAHLQFLEEFFRQILPEIDGDAMEYLNTLINRIYSRRGIDQFTNLTALKPEDYPIFDDLYDCILEEFQHTKSDYLKSNLRVLMNYVAKFSTGGRNANIWNGPSTLSTAENFIVFNFQTLLSNRNNTVANAQMLLVLKYLDNEIIKNREYNMKYGASRKIIVVIDEAHVFIDAKYPLALDFMFQLAKRIRKYNGMQIVITQNIKDFVGSEKLARKSTAIINACQYSFIFSLAPNDMHDLCTLYEKAGGINESEQEQIISAPRGQAFVVTSPTSRTSLRIETPNVSRPAAGTPPAPAWEPPAPPAEPATPVSAEPWTPPASAEERPIPTPPAAVVPAPADDWFTPPAPADDWFSVPAGKAGEDWSAPRDGDGSDSLDAFFDDLFAAMPKRESAAGRLEHLAQEGSPVSEEPTAEETPAAEAVPAEPSTPAQPEERPLVCEVTLEQLMAMVD